MSKNDNYYYQLHVIAKKIGLCVCISSAKNFSKASKNNLIFFCTMAALKVCSQKTTWIFVRKMDLILLSHIFVPDNKCTTVVTKAKV